MSPFVQQPAWDISRSFEWNYDYGPFIHNMPFKTLPRQQTPFLSWELRSPLGVAAGPLPNARYIEAYAQLGYSFLTYKTVRTCAWNAHPAPILVRLSPVRQVNTPFSKPLVVDTAGEYHLSTELSCANSVGLPSAKPEYWREDVRRAREVLREGQILIVSVVGTPEVNDSIEQLADDFALCACWAHEAGADMIEVNLSCPNVQDEESDIYLDPEASALIIQTIRAKTGNVPLSAKLGYYDDQDLMYIVLSYITPYLDALTLINAVKFQIVDSKGNAYFPGMGREFAGVGGAAIYALAYNNVGNALDYLKQRELNIPVIAVGGVTHAYQVDEYLDLGATLVAVGTTAIWRPSFPYEYARFREDYTT